MRVLALPDLEQSKAAVLNSLMSKSGQRTYEGAITDFVEWYCSEPSIQSYRRPAIPNLPGTEAVLRMGVVHAWRRRPLSIAVGPDRQEVNAMTLHQSASAQRCLRRRSRVCGQPQRRRAFERREALQDGHGTNRVQT